MDTKLTLKLDGEVIRKAKEYAASHNRSLSGLVENYLKLIVDREATNAAEEEIQISSFVREMTAGPSIPAELDPKEIYRQYLEEKHS